VSGEAVLKEITGRIGKYDIVKPLGKGAMGIVYLAKDSMLDREVALKVMVSNIADDPDLKMRFEREAKAVAKLSHANVVNVFDLGYHTDGSPYMAMELLRGDDLQKTMRMGPMPLDRKVSIIVQVLVGLAHAHQAGIVHRDIKPANIFIGNDGSVKIMDFGVARLTTASVTGTGAIVGTADYMSPEQVKGARVDGRSDLFSVGCMFYEMLVGKRPFHAENLMAIFFKITHDEPNWNTIPQGPEYDALTPILAKALAKNLDDRYENATQFALALRDYLATYSTSASAASRALEDLVDLAAPTGTPAPLEDLLGDTSATDGTVDLSKAGATRVGAAATQVGRQGTPTLSGTKAGATRVGATRVQTPVAPPARIEPKVAVEAPKSNTGVIAAGFVGLIVTLGGGVYFIANKLDSNKQGQNAEASPSPAVAQTTALPTPAPVVQATAAPAPTFAEPVGKAASIVRSASEAFSHGDYDKAIQRAQDALREDPGNSGGQKILDQARNGKEARGRLASARSALGSKDYARARQIAKEASSLAPWDAQVTDVLNDISKAEAAEQALALNAAQAKALQEKQALEAAVNQTLSKATAAFTSDKFDEAIALYDEVLKLDPSNAAAQTGKIGATTGKKAATAAAAAASAAVTQPPVTSGGKTFASGRTDKKAGGPQGLGAAGFGDAAGVKSATQAADMPGSISFELQPKNPRPGDAYKVIVKFTNEGSAPIALNGLTVRMSINGKGVGAAQPLAVSSVAPGDTAIIYSAGEVWSDSITEWGYTATVTGPKGETYRNTVTWK
jgi:tRNA A-37 threonylcarbamoyl transferase component Bud32/tetratricopeptide (TPR) repeat protein